MSTPVVSVILPTYNRSHRLGRAISSVLSQTYADFELILVDDGSTDNTKKLVGCFSDPRVRYLRHRFNRGASAARNTGIASALGEFLAFQDSDDEWLPEKLSEQLHIFWESGSSNVGAVLCGLVRVADGKERIFLPKSYEWTFEDILARSVGPWATPLIMVRRTKSDQAIFFDEKLLASQDWDYLLQLSRACVVKALPIPLVRKHEGRGLHSKTIAGILESSLVIHRKYIQELQSLPLAHSKNHLRIALCYSYLGDHAGARKHLWRSFRAYPWSPKAWIRLLVGLLGNYPLRVSIRLLT